MRDKYTDEHLEYTIKVWQKYFPYTITKDKAVEICDNVSGFVRPFFEAHLKELQEKEKLKQQSVPPIKP
jgi:ATP-dependent Clp protease ATP-binding subunit ClpA